jgi:uncharacterized integral membrane protein
MTDSPKPTGDGAAVAPEPAPEPGRPGSDRSHREKKRQQDRAGDGSAADRKVFVGTGFFWGLIVGLVLATMVIILAAQNTASVTVHFLGWRIETPLIVLILGALLIGIILDEIAGAIYRRRRRRILNERAELERLRGASDKD